MIPKEDDIELYGYLTAEIEKKEAANFEKLKEGLSLNPGLLNKRVNGLSLLDHAVKSRSLEICKLLVDTGKIESKILGKALQKSVKIKNFKNASEISELLLKAKAEVNKYLIPETIFPMMAMVDFENGKKLLELLLVYGANINVFAIPTGYNLLELAVRSFGKGHFTTETYRLLMDYYINPELSQGLVRQTPLMYVAGEGLIDLCDLLLKYGADITMEDYSGTTALFLSSFHDVAHHYFLKQFEQRYPHLTHIITNVNKRKKLPQDNQPSKLDTKLLRAAYDSDIPILEEALKAGANIHCINDIGYSVLHLVKQVEIAELLMKHGANVLARGGHNETVLYTALNPLVEEPDEIKAQKALIEFFLTKGVEPFIKTINTGSTVLHKASLWGMTYFVQLFLEQGLDANDSDIYGKTPLMRAAQKEELETIKILLAHGANPHLKCLLGKTALGHTYTAEVREVLSAAMASYEAGAGAGASSLNDKDDAKKKLSGRLNLSTLDSTSSFSASGLFAKLTASSSSSARADYAAMPFPKIAGLVYQPIAGDGHCLFNAVALYVGQEQSALRHIVATHIEAHLDDYRDIITAINPGRMPEEYLADLRKGIEWGDNLEIAVLMQVLDRPIHVIEASGQLRKGLELDRFKGEPIFVYYNGHNHYDAYVLAEGWDKRASEIASALLSATELSHSPKETVAAGGAGAS